MDLIASKLTQEVKVLCFDEFFVDNISDAMLLGALLKALFVQKIYFIANSNIPPDDIYKKGLQREKFLSAISLIKSIPKFFI
ncbi:AFG1/ZapE family ATPase [Candidatus Coxiella mudrowiae]|uniref:AFG1/ZapE family ATPase n=1 Tax=Candidatus Coxiella mudrowiae TaxID=2054173 RepID=UPI0012FF21DA|nr:AFG1/ZapE family ATPase [Candidatus Coxiella mudrowiae]